MTVVVADAYPNFSICGIPYYISGEVVHWQDLAHRSYADLEATGMRLRLETEATRVDVEAHQVWLRNPDGSEEPLSYDRLVVGTGAVPVRPPIEGLAGPDALGEADGVHLLHTMGDTFSLRRTLDDQSPATALIVGAGYVGLEMAEGLTMRGLRVAQVEMLPEVLPTVDLELGALVRDELTAHGVDVSTSTTVRSVARAPSGSPGRLVVEGSDANDGPCSYFADLVLVSVGVRPDTDLLVAAGAQTGVRGAVVVDEGMRTGLPDVYAAGDCVVTLHRLLGVTYLPLGTTAHKQGRVAGENAVGGRGHFRRQPRDPGGEGVRPRGGPHRPPRPRGGVGWLQAGHHPELAGRPQGLLPDGSPHHDPGDRGHRSRAGCWVLSWSAGAAPRFPSGWTFLPPPFTTT